MTLEEVMRETGVDKETTLRRFSGNTSLLARIIRQYPADPTFGELETALAEGNQKNVERAAHTLKGVAANLGFQPLSDKCAEMVAMVRNGRLEGQQDCFEDIAAEHAKIVGCIQRLDA